MKKQISLRNILIICIIGLIARLAFTIFLAEPYFGRKNIHFNADTYAWQTSFINWWETGVYTSTPGTDHGYFVRTPGYTMFYGIFYLVSGKNLELSYKLTAYAQIILDILALYFLIIAASRIYHARAGIIAGILYALYPFIIVWTPVVYSESLSVFFMIWTIYLLYVNNKYKFLFAGITISFAILCRPQIALIVPFIGLYIIVVYWRNKQQMFINGLLFSLAVIVVYGSWPIRNYINYNKIMLTQSWKGDRYWQEDICAFYLYIYSVKAEWEPQFGNILGNKKVAFPKEAYLSKADSLKLEETIKLCQTCGSGFSQWRGYWKETFFEPNCNAEIAKNFMELRDHQMKYNTLNFWLWVPLQNLKKALFKSSLSDSESFVRKLASLLFLYRTLLLLIGFVGLFLMLRDHNMQAIIIGGFFISLYILLCFSPGLQFRNIEIRYFLPADVLLILPGAYLITYASRFLSNK